MKTLKNNKQEFLNFLDNRRKNKNNQGKSFTYWCAFYDFMKQRTRPRTQREEERDIIELEVCLFLDINQEKVDKLKPIALLEILDISILDEIALYLYFNDEKTRWKS